MELAIVLSLAASVCTATSSVCQRLGARHLERCGEMRGHLALRGGKARGLSSHISGGPAAIFTNWSAYVLMGVGTGTMLLTSHAMAAGPLAASQPGFTIGDPVTAIRRGVFVFQKRLASSPAALAAEVAGLAVLVLGVWTLSGSELITHTTQPRRPEAGETTNRELTRRSR